MRKLRAAHDVAHGPDAGQIGAAFVVNLHETAFVNRKAHGLRADARNGALTAHGHKELFKGVCRLRAVALDRYRHAFFGARNAHDSDAELKLDALPGEGLESGLRNSRARKGQHGGRKVKNGGLGAVTRPDASELKADHARSDDAQALRGRLPGKRARVRADHFFVETHARQRARGRAAGNHHLAGFDRLTRARFQNPAALAPALEVDGFVHDRDARGLEHARQAPVGILDRLGAVRVHGGKVHDELGARKTEGLGALFGAHVG